MQMITSILVGASAASFIFINRFGTALRKRVSFAGISSIHNPAGVDVHFGTSTSVVRLPSCFELRNSFMRSCKHYPLLVTRCIILL